MTREISWHCHGERLHVVYDSPLAALPVIAKHYDAGWLTEDQMCTFERRLLAEAKADLLAVDEREKAKA
jgi:hypothetical protein